MKNLISLFIFLLICIGCKDVDYPVKEHPYYHEAEPVGLDDFYRKVTGYDSVQLIYFMGKWEANFCWPNKYQWNYKKFRAFDTLFAEPTAKYSIDTCFVHSPYYLVTNFYPVTDSSKYYGMKYKEFIFRKTKASTYIEIQRYSDSILRYAELISKIKK